MGVDSSDWKRVIIVNDCYHGGFDDANKHHVNLIDWTVVSSLGSTQGSAFLCYGDQEGFLPLGNVHLSWQEAVLSIEGWAVDVVAECYENVRFSSTLSLPSPVIPLPACSSCLPFPLCRACDPTLPALPRPVLSCACVPKLPAPLPSPLSQPLSLISMPLQLHYSKPFPTVLLRVLQVLQTAHCRMPQIRLGIP